MTFVALVISALVLAPIVTEAVDVEKNNGIPVERGDGAALTVPDNLPYGTRVQAVVDYPSGSDCIRFGDTGTIYCYDPNDPVLSYLVNWDRACGFEQCQVCGICAPHGWWVSAAEISQISQLCPVAQILTIPGDSAAEAEKNVAISRAFRDRILSQSEEGREFIGLYYLHSSEFGQIMTENPELFSKTAQLFLKAFPTIKKAAKNDGMLYLQEDNLSEVYQLLNEYEALASPELAASIQKLMAFLEYRSTEISSGWVSIDLND